MPSLLNSTLLASSPQKVRLERDENQIELITYIKCLLFQHKEDLPYLAQPQLHFLPPLSSSSEHSWRFHRSLHPAQVLHNNPWQHTQLLYANQGSSSSVCLPSAAIHQGGDRNRTMLLQLVTSFNKWKLQVKEKYQLMT